jgi:general secretion pathway protein D
MPLAAFAQNIFDDGSGSSVKPWESFKLPKKTIKLDLSNASADAVISLFEQVSGVTIVKDPALNGKLPITSARAVDLNTAFNILNTKLDLMGYTMSKQNNLLVIRQKPQQRGGRGGGFDISMLTNSGGGGPFGGGDNNRAQLKVYPIQYASATQVARVINDVYSAAPTGGFGRGGGNPFGGGGGRFQFGGGGGRGGGNPFGGGGPGGGFAGFGGFNQQQIQVKASSDDFSNSVIVNAPDSEQTAVSDIIRKIDKPTDVPQQSQVYRLIYAAASDVAPVIQNVLASNVPQGRGGAGQNTQNPFQQIASAFRGTQAGAGQVAADTRTNSLVVTATADNQKVVERVVRELDTQVETHSSTFVFPLANAKATDVANLLLSTFGQRQGVTNNTGRNTSSTSHVTTINGSSGTGSSGVNGGRPATLGSIGSGELLAQNDVTAAAMRRAAATQDGSAQPIDLSDPEAVAGELLTNIAVTQGFGGQRPGGFAGGFGGGFGGQTQSSTTAGTQVRDANGQLININDLTGKVTVIADPNTNSLIVVTAPDGADIIRRVISQLDQIPQQVVIQTMIVEASLDATDKLGVEWKFANNALFHQSNSQGVGATNFGLQTNPPAQGFSYTLTSNNLDAYINALKTDQKFRVLSTPRIFTSNNVTAQINISQSIPYITSSIENTTGTFTNNYQFLDVGIVLTVTPQITSNGYVTMDVTQTANDLQGFTTFNAPIVNQRQATTTVSVKDNETVILGGIIQHKVTSTVNKIPILGDIPILGNLFKSSTKEDTRTELLVFMTPRIIKNDSTAMKVTDDAINQLGPDTREMIKQATKGGMLTSPNGATKGTDHGAGAGSKGNGGQ